MHKVLKTIVLGSTFVIAACSSGGANSTPAGPAHTFDAIHTEAGAQRVSTSDTAVQMKETPRSADAFVDSVGINTHLYYSNTPYVSGYSAVRSYLAGLHIRHLRDGLVDNNWQPYYDHLNGLASIGIHADLVADVNVPMSLVAAYPARLPHAIESIEGPNEYDNSGDSNWVADLRAYQQLLYDTVKRTPSLSSFPIVGPSFTSYNACMSIGSLANYSDDGNMHVYFSSRNPGTPGWGSDFPPYGVYGSIAYNLGIVKHVFNPRPIMATETGWDDGATSSSVSPAVKARYTMRALLELWNAGVSRTYLYELLDEGGQHYGLLNGSLAPKPAYTALANLLGKLDDPGAISLMPLTYTLSADSSVHHTLLQKRDGSYRLMLWIEKPATDPVIPIQTVTLSLPSKFRTIVQYTWQDSGLIAVTNLTEATNNSLELKVTDRVTELKLQQ